MSFTLRSRLAQFGLMLTVLIVGVAPALAAEKKACVAHRGASAYYPEHTLEAYKAALEMKADFVEQDLMVTKDGRLICLHDNGLERTTNVEEVYPDRFHKPAGRVPKNKTWRPVDFTLAEIKKLDAGSWKGAEHAGYKVPTFEEAIELVKGKAGIYPELKSPGFAGSSGHDMGQLVLDVLKKYDLDTLEGQKRNNTPVIVQCFESSGLTHIRDLGNDELFLVQLLGDIQVGMLSPAGLKKIATYANGIGPSIKLLEADRSRVTNAHDLGLKIHPYTVNAKRIPSEYKDTVEYVRYLLFDLGVDGVFTDNPDLFPRD